MEAAFVYVQTGFPDEAVKLYDKAIDIEPLAEAYFGKAIALQVLDEKEKAEEAFEMAFELDPRYKELVDGQNPLKN